MKKIKKITLIALGLLGLLVVAGVLAPYLYILFQKPNFVNKDLALNSKLNIPTLLQPHIENGEKVFDLSVQQGETEFLPGKKTNSLTSDELSQGTCRPSVA